MAGMTGTYEHTLDAKGRVFIPFRLRPELGEVFYLTISVDDCLCAYSQESWDRFYEKVLALPKRQQLRMRPLFANASRCELDSQGRVIIPQKLRERVGMEKNITIVGNGECAEFWDSDRWNEISAEESSQENLAELYEEIDI